MQSKMILRPPPITTVRSNTQQLALQVWTQLSEIQWLSEQVILEIIKKKSKIVSEVFAQSRLFNTLHNSRMT